MKSDKDLTLLRKLRSLPDEANPTEWEQLSASRLEEELKKHRFLDCKHYKKCLDYTSDLRWQGWSCHWCNLKVEEKKRRNPYDKLDRALTNGD